MSNITNEALWGKLDEISKNQKSLAKEDIEDIVMKYANALGKFEQSQFDEIKNNNEVLNSNILKMLGAIQNIKIPDSHNLDNVKTLLQKKDIFNFVLFKVRKSSFVIAVLGVLIFILSLFSMKQQNDYSLLTSRYYRQAIVIDDLKSEVDSLKTMATPMKKKK
ncbi:hypothetical protein JGH11_17580 [Dysgonomonas sp. Marseille-P4677]|uniref:hypothetical protein n=1 Tax=Dysgonomonas sp. Marseille-P4677 TaxID=2364790 RepID=UPI0019142151|nr:hypothetical protein [Dysgonomonas sp. Marseille-P4677]MBK5722688.1 hypothetical protein [Dysgonomonas sp. Marseille-P4677]